MAEEVMVFNANPKENSGEFTVPEGEYPLTVWECESAQSKKGYPMLKMKLGVNGQKGRRSLFHYITFIPKGQEGHGMTIQNLEAFGINIKEGNNNIIPSSFIGKVVRAKLTIEEYNGYDNNKIKGVLYPAEEGDTAEFKEAVSSNPTVKTAKTEEEEY